MRWRATVGSPRTRRGCDEIERGAAGKSDAIMSLGASSTTSARGVARVGLAAILVIGVAGCQPTMTPTPVPNAVTGQNPADVKYYPSDEPVKLGIQRFYDGNFGLAQQYFQDAVEKTPKDVTAWVGLAASYDRLGRFDLADRSYAAAVKLVGHTPEPSE